MDSLTEVHEKSIARLGHCLDPGVILVCAFISWSQIPLPFGFAFCIKNDVIMHFGEVLSAILYCINLLPNNGAHKVGLGRKFHP